MKIYIINTETQEIEAVIVAESKDVAEEFAKNYNPIKNKMIVYSEQDYKYSSLAVEINLTGDINKHI